MEREIEAALEQREAIAAFLATLTDAQREAVRLCWAEGYTQAEAAEMLGITRQGVAKRLALARNHADMVAKHPSK
jgi:RNA polymerase sigma factor (sigma-70 family)